MTGRDYVRWLGPRDHFDGAQTQQSEGTPGPMIGTEDHRPYARVKDGGHTRVLGGECGCSAGRRPDLDSHLRRPGGRRVKRREVPACTVNRRATAVVHRARSAARGFATSALASCAESQ